MESWSGPRWWRFITSAASAPLPTWSVRSGQSFRSAQQLLQRLAREDRRDRGSLPVEDAGPLWRRSVEQSEHHVRRALPGALFGGVGGCCACFLVGGRVAERHDGCSECFGVTRRRSTGPAVVLALRRQHVASGAPRRKRRPEAIEQSRAERQLRFQRRLVS